MISHETDTLVCEVVDNGVGMEGLSDHGDAFPDPKRSRQLFSGIGIRNVHDRITLLYGPHYGVSISSKPGEGTKVKIRLPLIKI
ncbi:Histidine kinase-, DNA gyrase B-, and HSP90-like ATPase [compost metagenome]